MVIKKTAFNYIVWKEGKYYVAQCLNIDVSSFGKAKKGAVDNLKEAVELYLEDTKTEFIKVKSPSLGIRELQHV